jgi:hypothetical protein
MSANADAAQRFARAGWPVFPTRPNREPCPAPDDCPCKAPLTRHGLRDAETDPRTVARFWARHPDANVAIATGAPGPTVLDVDVSHGRPGPQSLNRAIRAGLVPTAGALVRTPSGGQHHYYKGDAQRNAVLEKSGLDLRGQGGYVVAPPSLVHGKPYELVHYEREMDTSIDFGPIRELLEPQPQRVPWQPREGQPAGGVGHLPGYVARLQPGNRNDLLWWAAWRVAQARDESVMDQLARAAESTGLSRQEVDRTIASARHIADNPRTATPAERAPFRDTDREAGG